MSKACTRKAIPSPAASTFAHDGVEAHGSTARGHGVRVRMFAAQAVLSAVLIACQRPAQSSETSSSSTASAVPVSTPPAAMSDADLTARLCAERAGCRFRRRRAVAGADGIALVDIAIARGPLSPDCDGAEYWVVRSKATPSSQRVLKDCDAQMEADEPAHADTRVEGTDLVVAYEERLGGDLCKGVDARIHLGPLRVVTEKRWDGPSRKNQCIRENEITTDWDTSEHIARWTQSNCKTTPAPSTDPTSGAAISKVSLDGSTAPTAVGTCGTVVDGVRAGHWTTKGAAPPHVRLRAVVIDDKLLVDVEGATTGSLSIVVASAADGDGEHGSLGCASEDDRRVSSTTIHLEDGRTESKGPQAPFLKVASRDSSAIHFATESIASVGRLALSYESPTHEKLDSSLLRPSPKARDLPPFDGPFRATDRCRLEAGRLEVRRDDSTSDPVLKLR